MLDVRKLRLLRELAHRATIAAVADALAYTPSAVSQQLATLEREAGVPLLERTGRRVTPPRPVRFLCSTLRPSWPPSSGRPPRWPPPVPGCLAPCASARSRPRCARYCLL